MKLPRAGDGLWDVRRDGPLFGQQDDVECQVGMKNRRSNGSNVKGRGFSDYQRAGSEGPFFRWLCSR